MEVEIGEKSMQEEEIEMLKNLTLEFKDLFVMDPSEVTMVKNYAYEIQLKEEKVVLTNRTE